MNASQQRWNTYLLGPVMFWTVLTSLFAWLPLVRIIGRPEGYRWAIGSLSGTGTDGPFWIFVPLTLFALLLLYSGARGPRKLFYPLLLIWHIAVTATVVSGVVASGDSASIQGQGLHWQLPSWLVALPCIAVTIMAAVWIVMDIRSGIKPVRVAWTTSNTKRLLQSLLLLVLALVLFRAGTNYNWVTAAAILATIAHWLLLVDALQAKVDKDSKH